ncbi:putative mitochondrial protein [Cucumis melo var. makuwa]|uniref:Putative mitochondrial protein n=1 Tax=Cucumis melo var. makuwa TaxID=1194695 RepID=A0A5D3CY04_CUCMM|nr:putative mitochondrial protein [Cucumis melo var. makuwa]
MGSSHPDCLSVTPGFTTDQHVLGAHPGHRRLDFHSYESACCTCSGTCQLLGEGKGRGKLASDREGSVTCHMGTQYGFLVIAGNDVMIIHDDEPRLYQEAMTSSNSETWLEAMKYEMQSM